MLRFCYLEVGHVHSAAFVISDSPINHGRGSVNAQWLCSAGGLSLWMPGLQPRCSTSVLCTFPLLLFLSAPTLQELTFLACPLCIHLSPLSFNLPSPHFPFTFFLQLQLSPCPWSFWLNFKSSYHFVSLLFSTVQPLSPSFPQTAALVLRYSARPASAISQLALQALDTFGFPGVLTGLVPLTHLSLHPIYSSLCRELLVQA